MARLRWKAFYYDGKTARRHEVEATLYSEAMELSGKDISLSWRYEDITQTQGRNAGEPVRLENGQEAVIVAEEGFIEALKETSPHYSSRFYKPSRAGRDFALILAALLLSLSVGAGAYLWGIPRFSALAAGRVPPAAEEMLGRRYISGFLDASPGCTSPVVEDSVRKIMARLEAAAPPNPYKFRVYVLKNEMVNAFAAPGGYIVVFSGLIEKTKRPEELAGVLAHEMEHVLKKHVTKRMFQNLSTGMLVSSLLGDFHGASGAVSTIGTLRYSRITEDEADRLGAGLLVKANIDPKGMADFFSCLCGVPDSGFFKYLSTHPASSERAETIRRLTAGVKKKYVPLLPGIDWKKARASCG